LFVYDATTRNFAALQCQANGAGNALVTTRFRAISTGIHTLLVYGHVSTVMGGYSLRVLPKYHEAGADWDGQNFEPNNSQAIAYSLTPAQAGGLTAAIEQRASIYGTNGGDRDWYTFPGLGQPRRTLLRYRMSAEASGKAQRSTSATAPTTTVVSS
jgi:hypothetical protein